MNRIGVLKSTAFHAARVLGVAVLMMAAPGRASAQDAAAPAQDVLKFGSNAPALILMQIHMDKTADFEAAWATIRATLAKSPEADVKAFGETLGKLSKVDQPPIESPQGKGVLYILQLDSPSTAFSYNPFEIVWKVLWKAQDPSLLTRPEADALFAKLQPAFLAINPPWKLIRVGGGG